MAVHSWSHVSRVLNTNADASYSFRTFRQNLLRRTSKDDLIYRHVQLCAVRALTLVHTVVEAADVSRRGEPTISSCVEVCVRRSMVLSAPLSPSFYPDPYFIKHTLPLYKTRIIYHSATLFFLFFPRWSKCTDHQTLIPPRDH